MNLTLIVALAGIGLGIGGYIVGRMDGVKLTEAKIAEKQELVEDARNAMILAAAEEIAKIEVKHVTIREELQTEVIEKPVYRECVNTPDGLRLINQALTNGREPVAEDSLPGADPS